MDRRAVSPVLGVALLIAITVILAGVIGFVVLGVNSGNAEGPSASLVFEQDNAADGSITVTMEHKGGEVIKAANVEYRGAHTGSPAADLSTGSEETITTTGSAGEEIRVVWMDPNSDREVLLAQYTIE